MAVLSGLPSRHAAVSLAPLRGGRGVWMEAGPSAPDSTMRPIKCSSRRPREGLVSLTVLRGTWIKGNLWLIFLYFYFLKFLGVTLDSEEINGFK